MKNKKPYLVAEISANHCGNFALAKKLIKCAKINGADAVKLQTYTADTMTIKSNKKYFKVKSGLWKGYQLWDLYDKAHTPLHWHDKLFKYARSLKIEIFSTPFDESAVDFLEKLNCPFYKVASFEMTDLPLIKKIAKTKKPIIISTGKSKLIEVKRAIRWIEESGNKKIVILHCTATYPADYSSMNLNNISTLKKQFDYKIGLSDHNKENLTAVIAVTLGAKVIEKHITLNRKSKGPDHHFALEPKHLIELVENIKKTEKSFGSYKKDIDKSEIQSRKIGNRSIHVIKDLKKGELIKLSDIVFKRPNLGIEPYKYKSVIGKKVKRKIKKDMWLKWNDIESK